MAITLPTITIVADPDDGSEFAAATTSAATLRAGVQGGFRTFLYARFPTGVDIPQGSIIDSAIWTGSIASFTGAVDIDCVLFAEDEDTTLTPNDGNPPSLMTPTTASTPHTFLVAGGAGADTIDATSVVQEIVNRPGWASGNALTILVRGDPEIGNKWAQFDNFPLNPMTLDVTYSEPGGGGAARNRSRSRSRATSPSSFLP